MTIEIVSFPIKHGDFPSFFVCLPEGIPKKSPFWVKSTLTSDSSHEPGRNFPEIGSADPIPGVHLLGVAVQFSATAWEDLPSASAALWGDDDMTKRTFFMGLGITCLNFHEFQDFLRKIKPC